MFEGKRKGESINDLMDWSGTMPGSNDFVFDIDQLYELKRVRQRAGHIVDDGDLDPIRGREKVVTAQ